MAATTSSSRSSRTEAGLKQITKIPFTGDTDGAEQADWSPDGQTIAFDAPSRKGGDTFINLFTVARDGTGLAELPLALPGFNGAPSYSPDGTKIAFDQDAGASAPDRPRDLRGQRRRQ